MFQQPTSVRILEGLLGVFAIIAGIVSFSNPITVLSATVIVIGIFAICQGLVNIFAFFQLKKLSGMSIGASIVLGILEIILGCLFLFGVNQGIVLLSVIFPIWFIVSCIFTLSHLDRVKIASSGLYWFTLIVNILGIIVGISLLFDPIASAATLAWLVGFYLIMIGIQYLVLAFTNISFDTKN